MAQLVSFPIWSNLIQTGWYIVTIVAATLKDSDSGISLRVTFKILDGAFKDRQVSAFYSLVNEDKTKEDIGRRTFSELVKACGFKNIPGDTDELESKTLKVYVGDYVGKDGEMHNSVKSYLHVDGSIVTATEEDTVEESSSGDEDDTF